MFTKEEVKRSNGSVYLHRWTLFRGKNKFWKLFGLYDVRIYVHKFTASDACDLHCHPNDFISIGLWGGYREVYWNSKTKKEESKYCIAPFFRFLRASHTHRVELLTDKLSCWTLVIMFPKKRPWGFYKTINGKRKFMHWKEYVGEHENYGACD